MRLIDLTSQRDENVATRAPRYTFCAYGPTGSGKTTLAGSFPRPVFLSETSESGYESLRGIAASALFEPDVEPIVLGIERMNDMTLAREALIPHIQSGMVQTVVIDSLTFYADLFLNYLFAVYAASGPSANLKAYGDLGRHLRDLRVRWHQLGCNVVSLCLPQDPNEDQPNGLPLIPGREANKFGASCDFLLYLQHERTKQGNDYADRYYVHSKPFGKYVARARRAVGMPELQTPLVNTSYSDLISRLGYSPEATRAAMPTYVDPRAAIQEAIDRLQAGTGVAPVAAAAPVAQPVQQPPVARHTPNARPTPNGRPAVSRRPAVARPTGNNS